MSASEGVRYHVLATDYDGTLAAGGALHADTRAALERLRASARKIVLVWNNVLLVTVPRVSGVVPKVGCVQSSRCIRTR